MGETPSPDDLTGRVLGSRYRIDRPLKRGGMGQVYAAHDELDGNKRVAVKVVRTALLEDPQAIARFKREARLVTELVHDNIVSSLAAGDDSGLLWIAMELLEGESLRERLDARGRMQWAETLPIIEQIVKALRVAHDKGVIHRDLKPENVMLVGPQGSERAKLLDFGVAKQAHVEGGSNGTSNMTGTGLIVGTPGYVAPEVVLEGRTDDPRSDFYALGVTWFEMLTAQKPFTAKTAFALAMRHAHEPAPTPTSLVPYSPVPHPIERLVLRLMAKNPEERPQNANALLDALKNLAEESQRALANPTPAPQSLEPHQATVTSTDLRGSTPQHTDVVPFRTPMSIQQPVAPSMTPPTALQPMAGTPLPQGTPLPADLVPQLLAAIPKKKAAAVGAAAIALIGIVAALVVVVLTKFAAFGSRPHDVTAADSQRRTELLRKADEAEAEAVAAEKASKEADQEAERDARAAQADEDSANALRALVEKHAEPETKPVAAAIAKAPVVPKRGDDKKADVAEKAADQKVDEKRPAASNELVTLGIYPDARGQNVQVSVDDGPLRNLPISTLLDPTKMHHFKFVFVDDANRAPIEHEYTLNNSSPNWKMTPTQAPAPK